MVFSRKTKSIPKSISDSTKHGINNAKKYSHFHIILISNFILFSFKSIARTKHAVYVHIICHFNTVFWGQVSSGLYFWHGPQVERISLSLRTCRGYRALLVTYQCAAALSKTVSLFNREIPKRCAAATTVVSFWLLLLIFRFFAAQRVREREDVVLT